nr:FG-GAP repeat protein [Sphaerisporangium rubeum]
MVAGSGAPPGAARTATCAGAADFDGDGRPDVVAGDPLAVVKGLRGAGAVHVLPLGDGTGAVLTAPDAAAGDAFGWSVRTQQLDDDGCMDVVVGAPYATVDGEAGAGAVYVFYGGAGREPVRLTASSPERDAHFGWSVAAGRIPGQPATLVVAAPYEDADDTTDSGAVYVYQGPEPAKPRRITQEAEGVIGNSEEGDLYGWSLAVGRLGGKLRTLDIAIGTPYENNDGAGKQKGSTGTDNSGAVEVLFDVTPDGALSAAKWTLTESARGVKEAEGDRFGHALAYVEHRGNPYLAVSAPLAGVPGAPHTGVVQLFQAGKNGVLAPARTIRPGVDGLDALTEGSAFGWSLAMVDTPDGLALAVGSPFESRDAEESGAVRRIPVTGDAPILMLSPPESAAHDRFGWSLGTAGVSDRLSAATTLLVGSPDQSAGTGALTLFAPDATPRVLGPAAKDPLPADFGAAVGG